MIATKSTTISWYLPSWGEWIEIGDAGTSCTKLWHLPAWGEWIEIVARTSGAGKSSYLPAWGEWIEMSIIDEAVQRGIGISPHGENGLKLGNLCQQLEKLRRISPHGKSGLKYSRHSLGR